MNKKVIKYVLIVCGIVLLFGLGIWGYKYIKNRNDDKKVNENENELKEVESLTSAGSVTVGSYTLNLYVNGVRDGDNSRTYIYNYYGEQRPCLDGSGAIIYIYDNYWYATIYINDKIKLKSSWLIYSIGSTTSTLKKFSSNSNIQDRISIKQTINQDYIVLGISNYYDGSETLDCYARSSKNFLYKQDTLPVDDSSSKYPYTKIFNLTTGDMIYAIPTNSNESISFTTVVYDGSTAISGSAFKNNMYVNANLNAIYYLKSNYSLSDGNNTEVHKVVFGDSYTNQYQDTIIGYTSATITLNS